LEDSGVFLFFLSSVLRKVGRLDAALRLAEESYRRVPCTPTAIARAQALSALGRVDEAVAAYRATMRFDPVDVAGLLDAAELLWQHERLGEAERLYEEIFRRSPDDPRAIPVYYYLRYLSSNFDPSWLERLRDFVDAHPEHPQGQEILDRMMPYFGHLPTPADAFVKLLHQLAETMANTPPQPEPYTLKYRVNLPEPPSNRLALALLSKRYGYPIVLETHVEAVPDPDPRLPLGRVWYQLWRYEGMEPTPVLPPPPDHIAQAIAAIAATDYDRSSWAESAARLGTALGPDRVDELLGVMVHPPFAREPQTPWDWVQRVQFAAALAVLGLDEGWAGSLRRKVLISLVNGPMDWSVSAAIVALAHLAATDPQIAMEALDVFRARLRNLPDRGHVCYALPLALAMLDLPGVTQAERAELKAKLRERS
jgi:tetratricopeptide (TPR) repeat protein